jgi:hypothetical protein
VLKDKEYNFAANMPDTTVIMNKILERHLKPFKLSVTLITRKDKHRYVSPH